MKEINKVTKSVPAFFKYFDQIKFETNFTMATAPVDDYYQYDEYHCVYHNYDDYSDNYDGGSGDNDEQQAQPSK